MLELQLMNRVKVLEHGFVLLGLLLDQLLESLVCRPKHLLVLFGLLLKLLLISLVHVVQEAFPLLGLGL
jgi:hypothetical protein